MTPRLVCFDCAGTLLEVRWSLGEVVERAAAALGLRLPDGAGARLVALHAQRLDDFASANRLGEADVARYWTALDARWLREFEADPALAPSLYRRGMELTLDPAQGYFLPFPDAPPALESLARDGVRLAVVSNWDRTLDAVLVMTGLRDHFEVVAASLEAGCEKPDPRLFRHALERAGVPASEAFHVGDDPLDDGEGAAGAGLRYALIDRARAEARPPYIRSLGELRRAFAWPR